MNRLASLIFSRVRRMHMFDVAGFFNLRGDTIPQLAIRVPLKGEQDRAIDAAHEAISKRVTATESAKSDTDITTDLKNLYLVWAACFDTTVKQKPDGSGTYHDPAFPSPDWMRDNLKTDEIAVLLNLLNLARAEEGPEPQTCDDITVETFVDMVTEADTTEVAAALLASCGREFCVELFLRASKKLVAARADLVAALMPPTPGQEGTQDASSTQTTFDGQADVSTGGQGPAT